MDIPDYFVDPNADGKEWIKRKILSSKWELRRTVEELEFVAEQYQMKKKYNGSAEELEKFAADLKRLLKESYDLAVQIRSLSEGM